MSAAAVSYLELRREMESDVSNVLHDKSHDRVHSITIVIIVTVVLLCQLQSWILL